MMRSLGRIFKRSRKDSPSLPPDTGGPSTHQGPGSPKRKLLNYTGCLIKRDPIGKGGFATVHLAELTFEPPRLVAVKSILIDGQVSERLRGDVERRLEREIHTWSHFDHENIVELLATCTDFNARSELNFKCLVMEYCEKGDMKTLEGAANGLLHMHNHNPPFVHGDIKAKNILVDGNQRAQICDFGLSRVQKSTSGARSGYTTATFAGSVRWMSPELVRYDQGGGSTAGFTRESDVWAFGCVILEAVTKGQPYGYLDDDIKVVGALLYKKLPWTSSSRQSATGPVDEGLWNIASRCWKQKPSQRLKMAQTLAQLRNLRVSSERDRAARTATQGHSSEWSQACSHEESADRAWKNGEWESAISNFSAAIDNFQKGKFPRKVAWCTYRLGLAHLDNDNIPEAERYLREAENLYSDLDKPRLQARPRQLLARIERLRDNAQRSKELLVSELNEAHERGWPEVRGWCLLELARTELALDNHREAQRLLEEALAISIAVDSANRTMEGRALEGMSQLVGIASLSVCLMRCRRALDCFREVRWPHMERVVETRIADLQALAPEVEEISIGHSSTSSEPLKGTKEKRYSRQQSRDLELAGNKAWRNGDWSLAITSFTEAAEAYRRIGAVRSTAYCTYQTGLALIDDENLTEAETHLKEAEQMFSELGDARLQVRPRQLLGRLERLRGDSQKSKAMLNTEIQNCRSKGWFELVGWLELDLALTEVELNDLQEARRLLEDALEIAIESSNKSMEGRALEGLSRLTTLFPQDLCKLRCDRAIVCFQEVQWPYMVRTVQDWRTLLQSVRDGISG
ncbi:Serine/threonine-protein kinase CTR1 [Ceratobasidium theobromae]|uniref:Serine/threonine-protein kinase CTR1 n=1 Tax=Ceratobasidium theobromae TaxID=1582974 RepID=A0A5N5QJA7_9AGAM|nr:Serine/threonine-protein kinase CTR1 [Ceratobasidium theobromae]